MRSTRRTRPAAGSAGAGACCATRWPGWASARAHRAAASRRSRGAVHRPRQRRRGFAHGLLPRALRRRARAVRAQFRPVRADGRIVGRGTADMKGGLVAHALRRRRRPRARPARRPPDRPALRLRRGDRQRRRLGAPARRRPDRPRRARDGHRRADRRRRLACQPRRHHAARRRARAARRTSARRISASTRSSTWCASRSPSPPSRTSCSSGGPAYPVETRRRAARCSSSAAPGSGANFNVVPGAAWFSVDRRFNPEEDLDEELARLTSTIEGAAARAGADVAVEVLQRDRRRARRAIRPPSRSRAASSEVEGAGAAVRVVPGHAGDPLVRPARDPGLRLRRWRLDVSMAPASTSTRRAMRRCAAVYALFAAEVRGDQAS